MDGFFSRTTAVADTGEALVQAALAAGYGYPFPFMVDIEQRLEGPILTMQGLTAFACLTRHRPSTEQQSLSVHARFTIEAAAQRLASALKDLDIALRALPGWAGGDVLGLYTRLAFRRPRVAVEGDPPKVFGTLCLELASLCPIMGNKASNADEPFRDTCDRLGRLLDHVWERTKDWDRENLCTWHVQELRTSPSKGQTPVREVFAPDPESALEADTWWHFQAPIYAGHERLPARKATCMSCPACSCSRREAS